MTSLGVHHPSTLTVRRNYAALLKATGQTEAEIRTVLESPAAFPEMTCVSPHFSPLKIKRRNERRCAASVAWTTLAMVNLCDGSAGGEGCRH